MTHVAYIGQITVKANNPYIVYGSVRGLVSQHRTLAAAQKSADNDARDCRKAGGYSDANVYEWNESEGWQRAGVAEDDDEN